MTKTQRIMSDCMTKFKTFGNGQTSQYNPLVNALADHHLMFAAGVDVEDVVRYVLARSRAFDREVEREKMRCRKNRVRKSAARMIKKHRKSLEKLGG